jgi:muramidase (phage lysozyme)
MRNALIILFVVVYTALAVQAVDARESARPKHVPGCNTNKCDKRMKWKAHQKTVKKWKAVARPYLSWLKRTGDCETRGLPNHGYTANTGNGFYGRYQFTWSSWRAVHGYGYPHNAEPAEQDYRTVLLLKKQGTGAWPVCGH